MLFPTIRSAFTFLLALLWLGLSAFAGNTDGTHRTLEQLLPEEFALIAPSLDPRSLGALALTSRASHQLVRENRFEGLHRNSLSETLGRGTDPSEFEIITSLPYYRALKNLGWWTGLTSVDFRPKDPDDCLGFLTEARAKAEIDSLVLHSVCLTPATQEALRSWTQLRHLTLDFDQPPTDGISWNLEQWGQVLESWPSLKSLELKLPQYSYSRTQGRWTPAIARLPQLRSLAVEWVTLDQEDAEILATTEIDSFSYLGHDSTFFAGERRHNPPSFLAAFLANKKLTQLSLKGFLPASTSARDALLPGILNQTRLKELSVSLGPTYGGDAFLNSIQTIAKLHQLRSFSFQAFSVTDPERIGQQLADILQSNLGLREVRIREIVDHKAILTPIAGAISLLPELEVLEISRPSLFALPIAFDGHSVLTALHTSGARLKKLILSGYQFSYHPWTANTFPQVFEKLAELDLSDSRVETHSGANRLLIALGSPSVKTLRLAGYQANGKNTPPLRGNLMETIAAHFPQVQHLTGGGSTLSIGLNHLNGKNFERTPERGRTRHTHAPTQPGPGANNRIQDARNPTLFGHLESLEWKAPAGSIPSGLVNKSWSQVFPNLKSVHVHNFSESFEALAQSMSKDLVLLDLDLPAHSTMGEGTYVSGLIKKSLKKQGKRVQILRVTTPR